MSELTNWSFPARLQPEPEELQFDLALALDSVVLIRAEIAEDAFTAQTLGTERVGNGVVIGDGSLILTVGYLVTEAESIWLTGNNGAVAPGYPLAYDFTTGFGLVQPLGRLELPALSFGSSAAVGLGDDVIVIGRGGRTHALKAQIIAKREFAGYWEYVLDEALYTAPPHPEWSGAALVGEDGRLLGIGSLFVQEAVGDESVQGNMFVPIDLVVPILDDLAKLGRRPGPARPWLGMYTAEVKEQLVVNGLAQGGPADRAGVCLGDIVLEVADHPVSGLADLFRRIWRLGPAGTDIPLTLVREGSRAHVQVDSADRNDYLKKPRLQ